MTKRFFIWLFWYLVVTLVFTAAWRGDAGTVRIPSWWGAVGLVVLFGWWGRFLAVKYPSRHKLIYGITSAVCLLMVVSAFSS